MVRSSAKRLGRVSTVRRLVRIGFIAWAMVSTTWLLNTFRTRDVPPETLQQQRGCGSRHKRITGLHTGHAE
jgi:hypothetical protein